MRLRGFRVSLLLVGLCATGCGGGGHQSVPAPNLLANGTFNQPAGNSFLITNSLPGWQVVAGNIQICPSTEWQPCPGCSQTLGLTGDSPGTIQQTFSTVPGRTYMFKGYLSHDFGEGHTSGSGDVYLNGQRVAQLLHMAPASQADMSWQPFTMPFTATATMTTLQLVDTTPGSTIQGLVLGNLSVS